MIKHDAVLPLGQPTEYPTQYAPELLFSIARAEGRAALGFLPSAALPFFGVDVWTHYEVSWLNSSGKPCVAAAEITVPAQSPYLIESKSLKLYFNSLNFQRFNSAQDFVQRVKKDLSNAAGADVGLRLISPNDYAQLAVNTASGVCLDDLPLSCTDFVLSTKTLAANPHNAVSETLHTNLLRSNCPVTNQPDWGSVVVQYEGSAINREGLLAYIVSYRNHADFHEQCVERIFTDILHCCRPQQLTVYARYTRRGGLDINPYRSTQDNFIESARLFRQ